MASDREHGVAAGAAAGDCLSASAFALQALQRLLLQQCRTGWTASLATQALLWALVHGAEAGCLRCAC